MPSTEARGNDGPELYLTGTVDEIRAIRAALVDSGRVLLLHIGSLNPTGGRRYRQYARLHVLNRPISPTPESQETLV